MIETSCGIVAFCWMDLEIVHNHYSSVLRFLLGAFLSRTLVPKLTFKVFRDDFLFSSFFKISIKVVIIKLRFLATFRLKMLLLSQALIPDTFLWIISKTRILKLTLSLFSQFWFLARAVDFRAEVVWGLYQVLANLLTLGSLSRLSCFAWFYRLGQVRSFDGDLFGFFLGLLETLGCFDLPQRNAILGERKVRLFA